jgi:hypothetical protein
MGKRYLVLSILLFLCSPLFAELTIEVPSVMNFQGRLLDNGVAVTGEKIMKFSIWTEKTAGVKLWEEVWDTPNPKVSVVNGIFNVLLGSWVPLESSVFTGGGKWLEIEVEGTKLGERQMLATVPYAFGADKTNDADLLDGKDSTEFTTPASDSGRSGVSSNLYEGAVPLTNKYVNKSGDTMSGNLNINKSVATLTLEDTNTLPNGEHPKVVFKSSGIDGKSSGAGIDFIMDSYAKIYTAWGEKLHLKAWNGIDLISAWDNQTRYLTEQNGDIILQQRPLIDNAYYDNVSPVQWFRTSPYSSVNQSHFDSEMGFRYRHKQVGPFYELQILVRDQFIYPNEPGYVKAVAYISAGGGYFVGGHDIAEKMETNDAAIVPGDVVVIGNNGKLEKCTLAYDSRVMGVISEENKIAVYMNYMSTGVPVCLLGSVLCKVDANYEAINIGDCLVTSSTVGHARKANPDLIKDAQLIGKALESLPSGVGMIKIWVK